MKKTHLALLALQLLIFMISCITEGEHLLNLAFWYIAINAAIFLVQLGLFIKWYKRYKRKWLAFLVIVLSGLFALLYYFISVEWNAIMTQMLDGYMHGAGKD